MAQTEGTAIIAGLVPLDSSDQYPTHYAEYGKGGLRTVDTFSDLSGITDDRTEEGMLAAVKDEGGTLYQLVDEQAGTWELLSTGSDFLAVGSLTERDNISSELRKEGLVVTVADGASSSLYQLRDGTTNADWVEMTWLTPNELATFVDNNAPDTGADPFPNRTVLLQITSAGSGEIITAVERGLLHEHSNRAFLDSLTAVGSGNVITQTERNNLHTHNNKAIIDALSDAGSGVVITSSERSDLNQNTTDRHTHSNKTELDNIVDAGSGAVITNVERDSITPNSPSRTADFGITPTNENDLLRIDPSGATDQLITVTLPSNPSGFGNLWACYFLQTGAGNTKFEAASGAFFRSPFDYNTTAGQASFCGVFHFVESGDSIWYLEGRLI